MDPTGSWLGPADSADNAIIRFIAMIALLGSGMLIAHALTKGISAYVRGVTRAIAHRLSPESPEWDRGEWVCGGCRSLNQRQHDRCPTCKLSRAAGELRFEPTETRDAIPTSIVVPPGARITLEHNKLSHVDGLAAHWRLRVNGQVVGSASRRAGALELLRAVGGTDTVLFDPRETGYASYRLDDLIHAFEQPRFPMNVVCPER